MEQEIEKTLENILKYTNAIPKDKSYLGLCLNNVYFAGKVAGIAEVNHIWRKDENKTD